MATEIPHVTGLFYRNIRTRGVIKTHKLPRLVFNTPLKLSAESPEIWSKQQVADWVSNKCAEYEIDENEVSKLKSQNGKGLDELSKEDWIRRSENHGDLFFKMWQALKQNSGKVADNGRHI